MAREKDICDSKVELEIERLTNSEFVRLARKEIRLKQKRRSYMNSLRWMERRGKELAAQGMTYENLERMIAEIEQAAAADE